MKTIKILSVIGVLFLTSFGNEVKAQSDKYNKYYYFAFAKDRSNENNLLITEVLYISEKDCDRIGTYGLGSQSIISQFLDYIEAEYNGSFDVDVSLHDANWVTKEEVIKARRETMKRSNKITKIYDFEYLCD